MIKEIILANFKLFKNKVKFPISGFNLLTGINGKGKSSLLQSLLLIRQSIERQDKLHKVLFNGSCVNLGNFGDIKNKNTGNDVPIKISFKDDNQFLSFNLQQDEYDSMIGVPDQIYTREELLPYLHIHYIAADRVGPQEFYIKTSLHEFINVGSKGDFLANVLWYKKETQVYDNLAITEKQREGITSTPAKDLLIQTGEWLAEIFGEQDVKVDVKSESNSRVITLLFGFGGGDIDFRPTNIGFGYTYILPILVSGLIAQKGEMLIVENPEAHLHPKAQANLVRFLAKVASCGVQVFIESHSEHFLNLTRLLIKEEQELNPKDVSLLFFKEKGDYMEIPIDDEGGIDLWPEDFFDESEKTYKKLLGF